MTLNLNAPMLIDQFEKHFMSFNRWLLILILAVMSVIIFANVTLRYTTSQSIESITEINRYSSGDNNQPEYGNNKDADMPLVMSNPRQIN